MTTCRPIVIWNNLKNDVLPKQSPSQAWRGAQDKSLAFMQIILETCPPSKSHVLDLNVAIGMTFYLFSHIDAKYLNFKKIVGF